MKTRLKTPAPPQRAPAPPPDPLVTPEGVAQYAACHRAWWLAQVQRQAPHTEAERAAQALASRQRLAARIGWVGAGLAALGVVTLVLGLLLG